MPRLPAPCSRRAPPQPSVHDGCLRPPHGLTTEALNTPLASSWGSGKDQGCASESTSRTVDGIHGNLTLALADGSAPFRAPPPSPCIHGARLRPWAVPADGCLGGSTAALYRPAAAGGGRRAGPTEWLWCLVGPPLTAGWPGRPAAPWATEAGWADLALRTGWRSGACRRRSPELLRRAPSATAGGQDEADPGCSALAASGGSCANSAPLLQPRLSKTRPKPCCCGPCPPCAAPACRAGLPDAGGCGGGCWADPKR